MKKLLFITIISMLFNYCEKEDDNSNGSNNSPSYYSNNN